MSDAAEPVSVIILDKKYQFACSPEERNDLVEAARQLDESMTDIKDSGRLMSLERIALQAALNFSAQILALKRNETRRQEKFDSKIRSLADQIDDALSS
ncbi:MAG: cell division protein ZapA [Xanthomonadales bacterium]|jgi:cell division protein ZapA|nr:cell division protein ZapA [Xanthomonadales bacterium]